MYACATLMASTPRRRYVPVRFSCGRSAARARRWCPEAAAAGREWWILVDFGWRFLPLLGASWRFLALVLALLCDATARPLRCWRFYHAGSTAMTFLLRCCYAVTAFQGNGHCFPLVLYRVKTSAVAGFSGRFVPLVWAHTRLPMRS